ncbi:O-antigen ligase family protein [Methylobacterium sp. JK268]
MDAASKRRGGTGRAGVDGLAAPSERFALSLLFLMLLMAYAAIGRDVFFNRLNDPNIDDPIGAILVYVRVAVCAAVVLVVFASAGLQAVREAFPRSLAPYIVLALVSCLWADEIKEVLRAALVLTALSVALPVVIRRLGRETTANLLLHLIAGVVIVSTLLAVLVPSIGTHTGQEVVQASHVGRWRGVFSHKNGLGPWAAYGTVTLLVYGHLLKAPWLYRMVAWLCAVACLGFSGSATSLIGCLTMFCGLALVRIAQGMGAGVTLLAAVIGLAAGAAVVTVFADQVFGLLGRDLTLTGRTEIWAISVDYIQSAPLLGHGYQTFGGPAFLAFVESYTKQAIVGPENMYLTSLLDLGLVGTLAFFAPVAVGLARVGGAIVSRPPSADRAALEIVFLIVLAALFMGITESTPFDCTGFQGAVTFCALFTVLQGERLDRRVPGGAAVRASGRAATARGALALRAPRGPVGAETE